MKAKPIFYQNGNDRRFEDQHTISVMTGEPMPRKWQDFFELTPEEKARWDAELKLDEEYRIAEAQGFPNGIPGGRTRGDMLYYFTQQEEARKKRMQEESFFKQSFIPRKTEIQNNNSIMFNNTLAYGQSNAQPSFTFNQKLNIDLPYTGQNNLLQMNTGIKKEPAFDVKQAIRKIANRLEARTADSEEQDKISLPTKLELYELLSPYGTTYKEIKEAYPQTAHGEEQVNVLDQEFDPTDSNMVSLYNQMMDLAFEKMEEKEKINPDDPSLTDYELYEIWSPYGARYRQIRKAHPTPEQEEELRKQAEEIIRNSPMPRLNYSAGDSVYERSVMLGGGVFLSPNLDLIHYLEDEKSELEKDLDQTVLDFFGSVNTILTMCPKDSRLNNIGARLGYLLLAVAALRCVLDVQNRREKLINDLVTQGRERREAEAETLPIYHKWLLDEIKNLVLGEWISDILPLILIPQEYEENKGSLMI